jgi:DNA-binding NarL/FixJ family response regulator
MTRPASCEVRALEEAAEPAEADGGLRFRIGNYVFVAMDQLKWSELMPDQYRRRMRELACGTLRIEDKIYILFAEGGLGPSTDTPAVVLLTRRELEIANEIARGAANKEIARLLGISHLTVREHIRRVCSKLGVHSRAAIAGRIGAPSVRLK